LGGSDAVVAEFMQMLNKDSAKVLQPWRYPCFNRKYIPDDI